MMFRPMACLATAGVLLLAGCGAESDEPPSGQASLGASATASATDAATGQPIGHASATDPRGDGGPADLLAVAIDGSPGGLKVTHRLAEPLPTTGTALLAISATNPTGDHSWQLGVKYIDGHANVFVFDMTSAKQDNVQATPTGKSSLSVTFPAASVRPLGPTFKWRAVSNIDGGDVDACPDEGKDVLSPATVDFPGP